MKFGVREIVIIVLLMCIPLVAWKLVFVPNNTRNTEMLKQIEQKQAKLRELNLATATIGDLKTEIQELSKAIGFFQTKLPNQQEIDKILQEIWRMAEANDLTTKSIRTKDRPTGTNKFSDVVEGEQPIAVQLEGDFKGLYSFLLALENQPRIMRIQNMKIEKMQKGEEGTVKADFVMSIFFEVNGKG